MKFLFIDGIHDLRPHLFGSQIHLRINNSVVDLCTRTFILILESCTAFIACYIQHGFIDTRKCDDLSVSWLGLLFHLFLQTWDETSQQASNPLSSARINQVNAIQSPIFVHLDFYAQIRSPRQAPKLRMVMNEEVKKKHGNPEMTCYQTKKCLELESQVKFSRGDRQYAHASARVASYP